jgi:hypothetical protein
MISVTIETRLKEIFELNFEHIRLEGGVPFTPQIKEQAWQQVLYYYRKLHEVAENVTDTEVKLTLPNLSSPEQRTYTIEGVVDIVREQGEVWMYDIKTHDADLVRANKEYYNQQLNVYSYIWENIRGNSLDHTAVISTVLPLGLKEAVQKGDAPKEKIELAKWEPIIELERDATKVDGMIKEFGCVVDQIENKEFAPPPVEVLDSYMEGTRRKFATAVCRNCDARFSCSSFREYAQKAKAGGKFDFKKYLNDLADPFDQEEWLNGNMNLTIINDTPTGIE